MRSLAERLGTYPATVYWHVGNRARLLALVADRVLEEIEAPDAARLPWRDWLASLAREYRRVMHRHPNVAGLVGSQLVVSPPGMQLVETILAVLADAGFAGQALGGALACILSTAGAHTQCAERTAGAVDRTNLTG